MHDDTRLIPVGERKLCVRMRGDGPTLVLDCGGAGQGTDDAWGSGLEGRLAGLTTLVTYDRAGVGRSGGPAAESVAEMADDLHHLLHGLGVPLPAVFAGWSFGALVVQVLALRHPHDVAGLVFVDPTVSGEPPGSAVVRTVSFAVAVRLLRLRALLPTANARQFRELAGLLAGLPRHMREVQTALEAGTFPPVPLRVITAGVRPRMPRAQLAYLETGHRALAARSPHGRSLIAGHATHQIPHDQPDIVVKAVQDVLHHPR
ncbi:alpha/beta fold hydrolase [Nonomuraea terrae]|uniref:alpha/beta fold hydrolase n=1 Tax=Nonomuraea terrae TaxID=2530383 RepID=UPI0037B64ECE